MNKCNNRNQEYSTNSPNTPNLNPYWTLPYIGTASIKLGKHNAALSRDTLGTDIKIPNF